MRANHGVPEPPIFLRDTTRGGDVAPDPLVRVGAVRPGDIRDPHFIPLFYPYGLSNIQGLSIRRSITKKFFSCIRTPRRTRPSPWRSSCRCSRAFPLENSPHPVESRLFWRDVRFHVH